jgi:hypothetical protein
MSYQALVVLNGLLVVGIFAAYLAESKYGYVQGQRDTEARYPSPDYITGLEEQLSELRGEAFERWKASRRSET